MMRLIILAMVPFVVFSASAFLMETSAGLPGETGAALYPNHLDGRYTGGFGEDSCQTCHFDYEVNHERGSLSLEGIEEQYEPGKKYKLTVTVRSERLENGGFQMTSRFEDGSQAGEFSWSGERITLTPSIDSDVQYVQHAAEGTRPTGEREVSWELLWTAPDTEDRLVIFNVAANAGNDDDSAFGDWIYVQEETIKSAK